MIKINIIVLMTKPNRFVILFEFIDKGELVFKFCMIILNGHLKVVILNVF